MKIRRRDLITIVCGAAILPSFARAQQSGRIRRVVVMTNVAEGDADEQLRLAAFREELRQFKWIEGNNIHLDYRWTAASTDLAKNFATEIACMKPDVIFVVGTTTVTLMLQHTRSIPVVFVTGADPVKVGFVKSLARPGGNATGLADFEDTIGAKWLQLLQEIMPTLSRVVYLSFGQPGEPDPIASSAGSRPRERHRFGGIQRQQCGGYRTCFRRADRENARRLDRAA